MAGISIDLSTILRRTPRVLFMVTSFDEVADYVSDAYRGSLGMEEGSPFSEVQVVLKGKKSVTYLREAATAPPWTAKYWMVTGEYSQAKGAMKDLKKYLENPENMKILIRFQRREYMEAKKLAQSLNIPLYWGDSMRQDDIHLVLQKYTKSGKLSQNALKYVTKGYYSSPQKVIQLTEYLDKGDSPVMTPADVREAVGYPAQRLNIIVDKLLKAYQQGSEAKNGLKKKPTSATTRTMREVYQDVLETSKIYNRPNSLRIALEKVVLDYIDIQDLYMKGLIYNDLKNDLKEAGVYEEYWANLRWYSRRIEDVWGTPPGVLLLLGSKLSKPWRTEADVIRFLVDWQKDCSEPVF